MTGVREILLAPDSRLPTLDGPLADARPFAPPFAPPTRTDEADALAMWINAHQLFFMLLCAATSCADRAVSALAKGRGADAIADIERISALRRAATELTDAAGAIAPELYASYIRPTMASMRSDFSGMSSRDNWRFDEAMQELTAAVGRALERPQPGVDHGALAAAWREQEAATGVWWERHAHVMRRLVADPTSLARLTYDKLVAERGLRDSFREYQKVLRTPDALDTNDLFFAVRRGEGTRATFRVALDRLTEWVAPRLAAPAREVIERGSVTALDTLDLGSTDGACSAD